LVWPLSAPMHKILKGLHKRTVYINELFPTPFLEYCRAVEIEKCVLFATYNRPRIPHRTAMKFNHFEEAAMLFVYKQFCTRLNTALNRHSVVSVRTLRPRCDTKSRVATVLSPRCIAIVTHGTVQKGTNNCVIAAISIITLQNKLLSDLFALISSFSPRLRHVKGQSQTVTSVSLSCSAHSHDSAWLSEHSS